VPTRSHNCSAVVLALPSLRSGCRGDGFLAVQSRLVGSASAAGPWAEAITRTADSLVRIEAIDPLVAYEFRVVAHNKDGPAEPSLSTGPLLTDSDSPFSLGKVTVRPSSSASFSLAWSSAAGICRPALRWRVLFSRTVASDTTGHARWVELATDVEGPTHDVAPLRCPAPGCTFQVEPLGVEWPVQPSEPVTSPTLPMAAVGSVRVELRLLSPQPQVDLLEMQATAKLELAKALQINGDSIQIKEIYGSGQYLIVDVQPASQAGQAQDTQASVLTQQLQLLTQELWDRDGALSEGGVTRQIDPSAGVRMLLDDGRLTPVHVSDDARLALLRLPRPWRLHMSVAGRITTSLCSVITVAACAYKCCRQALQLRHPYGRVEESF